MAQDITGTEGADAITASGPAFHGTLLGGNDTLTFNGEWDGQSYADGGAGTDVFQISFGTSVAWSTTLTDQSIVNFEVVRGDALLSTTLDFRNTVGVTLRGGSGQDKFMVGTQSTATGGDGDDYFGAMGSGNLLYGGNGADTFRSEPGTSANTFVGGAGGDLYYLTAGDTITEGGGAGAGADRVYVDFSGYTMHANVEELVGFGSGRTFTGNAAANIMMLDVTSGADNSLYGMGGDDTLSGNAAADIADMLYGGDGNDTLMGLAGSDMLSGDAGNDTLEGGLGDDTLTGGAGDDILNGMDGKDVLAGEAGADQLNGDAGDDILDGGEGDDILKGGTGADQILGGAGNDLIFADADNDKIDGGDGIDTLSFANLTTPGALSVNLSVPSMQNTKVAGFDTIIGIENVIGTDWDDTIYGNALANMLDGGAGIDTLFGGAGGDTLKGGAGDDQLYGEDGDDVLVGGAGTNGNALHGGGGNDWLIGGTAITDFDGGDGQDVASFADSTAAVTAALAEGSQMVGGLQVTMTSIEGLAGSNLGDTLSGNAGANKLWGLDGADLLKGGAGNDVLNGGAGDDKLIGGDGVDTASYDTAKAGVTLFLSSSLEQDTLGAGRDTLEGIENLTGSRFADFLTGSAGNNVFIGGLGNDRLDGAGGSDTASYANAAFPLHVSLAIAGAQDTGAAGLDTLISIENLVGSRFDDALTGNAVRNALMGGDGADTLNGGGGNDLLDGGQGDDLIKGGAGNDTASYASAGAYVAIDLELTGAQDTLAAGMDTLDSVESVIGTRFSDFFWGNASDNTFTGGLGNDLMDGRGGTDTASYANVATGVTVNLSDTGWQNTGGAGTDKLANIENLVGTKAADVLSGNSGSNSLWGGAGNDILKGGTGADTLRGGTGNDTVNGGNGSDTLYGGDGADSFVFYSWLDMGTSASGGFDVIKDFNQAQSDLIDLSAYDANSTTAGEQDFVFIGADGFHGVAGELRYYQQDGATFVCGDTNGDSLADFTLQIDGLITMDASDFVF